MNTTWSRWMCRSLNGTWLNCGRTSSNMTSVRYNNGSAPASWGAPFSNLSSHLNFSSGGNGTLAQSSDLLGLFPLPTLSSSSLSSSPAASSSSAAGTSGAGFNSSNALDISSSYTVVIIILSLLVIITILFTLCSLFMKAMAHANTDIHRSTGDTLLFTDKDSGFSAFSMQDDV